MNETKDTIRQIELTPKKLMTSSFLRQAPDGVSWEVVGRNQSTHFTIDTGDGFLLYKKGDATSDNFMYWCDKSVPTDK